jgi:hypothetical protein
MLEAIYRRKDYGILVEGYFNYINHSARMLEAILKKQNIEEQKKHSLIKGKIKYYALAAMLVADLITHYSCQEIKIVDPGNNIYQELSEIFVYKDKLIKNCESPKNQNDFKKEY